MPARQLSMQPCPTFTWPGKHMSLRVTDELEASAEINITPLIDVMLVLLIIFMVAAPLSTVQVPVDLPETSGQPAPTDKDPLVVTLTATGKLYIGDVPVSGKRLAAEIAAATQRDKTRRIFLSADRATDYGALMAAMTTLRNAGYEKLALVALAGQED